MKILFVLAWLAGSVSMLAAESQLVECMPRAGLSNFFDKLHRGGDVRIAYLGGSITAQEGWRPLSLNWFRQQYPDAKISEINAAIGGTGSDLGVFRLHHDVLDHKPDLIFIEFAVNDGGAPPEQIYRSMEGIVRQIWKDDPTADVCFVYTVAIGMLPDLQSGKLPRSAAAMEQIAGHYGIPSINIGLQVAKLEHAGKLVFKAPKPKTDAEKVALGDKIIFSPDGVHPYTDTGHPLYLDAIVRGMNQIKSVGSPGPHILAEPFVADNWENAKMIPLDRSELSAGWRKLDPETNSVAGKFVARLPELWKANQPGDSVQFKFIGTMAAIYDVMGPDSGQVIITLDDQKPVVRSCFDAYCTYYRPALLSIGSNLANKMHTVKIEIHPDQPDKAKILSQRGEKIDDPKRFDDRAWYAGYLMVVGNLAQ